MRNLFAVIGCALPVRNVTKLDIQTLRRTVRAMQAKCDAHMSMPLAAGQIFAILYERRCKTALPKCRYSIYILNFGNSQLFKKRVFRRPVQHRVSGIYTIRAHNQHVPLALGLLLMTSFFVFMGWTQWLWVGSLIAMVILVMLQPLLPYRSKANRRIGLVGSRFSPPEDEASTRMTAAD